MNNEVISNVPVTPNFLPLPITEDQHILGGTETPEIVLMKDSHGWANYLPLGETQLVNGVDPNSCPVGGSNNAFEPIGKFKYGTALNPKPGVSPFQNNLSERFGSIMMGMIGYGGNPHIYAEGVRNSFGAIPEVSLPFDSTIDTLKKYFSPSPMKYSLFAIGAHWKKVYELRHKWTFVDGNLEDKQKNIKEGLKYSPQGVAGYAWSLHKDGKYYNDGPAIHWFTVFDFVEGEYWLAFDTYAPFIKKLDWNYNFAYAKTYFLSRRLGGENVPNEPESAIIEYITYLAKWALSKFIKK